MKTNITSGSTTSSATEEASAWTRFWFSAIDPIGLHWVRFLSGLVFLSWLLPLTAERHALFGLDGYFDSTAYREGSRLSGGMPIPLDGWSLLYVFGSAPALLEAFWWGALAVVALFTLGIATRVTAALTWLVVVSFLASPAALPDTDMLLALPAFYLMLGYLGFGQWNRPLSLMERLLGPRGTSVFASRHSDDAFAPSYAANLALRLFQVNFALMVVTSALHKLQDGDWWAGVAYWYPLHPPLSMDAAKLAAERIHGDLNLFVLTLVGYVVLAWQFTLPLFAFRPRLRSLLLGGGFLGGLGAIFVLGEPTFGPLFFLGCLAYLTPGEWRWLTERVASPLQRGSDAETVAPAPPRPARVKASI